MAIGQTEAGRYLRVIYVPDPEPDSVFVITAYELRGEVLTAYRRRKRKRSNKHFPPGWDEGRVRQVLTHYETQTEDEAVVEDERSFEDRGRRTVVEIPVESMPVIRKVIAQYEARVRT